MCPIGASKLFNLFHMTGVSLPLPPTLTLPLTPCVHSDLHGEGGMLRLVIMDHNHVPAREGLPGRESDLRLGKNGGVSNSLGEIEINVRADVAQ